MENFPVNIDMYITVVGLILPLWISIIVSPDWTKQTKGLVSFGLVFVAAAGHLFFMGDFNLANFPGTLLKILFLSTGSYLSFWRPTGIKGVVEKKLGMKAKNTGTYGEKGFAKIKMLIVLAALAALVMAVPCFAGDKTITFAWEYVDPVGQGVDKFRIYKSMTSGVYDHDMDILVELPFTAEQTEYEVDGVLTSPDGQAVTWHFVATALDGQGNESGHSNEVSALIDFEGPAGVINFKAILNVVPE